MGGDYYSFIESLEIDVFIELTLIRIEAEGFIVIGDLLGISIGIRAGLVWGYYIVNVGQLIEYTNQVPVWVKGINGNPIAGVMGLVFLSGLTGVMSIDGCG